MASPHIAVTSSERAIKGSPGIMRATGPSEMRDMRETIVWHPGELAPPEDEKPLVSRIALRGQSHMGLWKWYHWRSRDDTRESGSRLQNGVARALV